MPPSWLRSFDLDSWSDYKQLIGRVLTDGLWGGEPENYWYRGQAFASWPLRSSFDRLFASYPPPLRKNVYQSMIDGLRDRLSNSEDTHVAAEMWERLQSAPESDSRELAALAQHYGAPTRLLDWSESPYIGAFFAFADISVEASIDRNEDTCCVIALNTLAAAWNSDFGVELVRTDRRTNARLRHQRGVFTLNSSTFSTLEDYCESFYSGLQSVDIALVRMNVPKAAAVGVLRDLEMMGITSESMFPGLEGMARYAFVRSVDRHIWRSNRPNSTKDAAS